MENNTADILQLKLFSKGCIKLLYLNMPIIDSIYLDEKIIEIFKNLKLDNFDKAENQMSKLYHKIPINKIIMYFSKISLFLTKEKMEDIPEFSKISKFLYQDPYAKDTLSDLLDAVDYVNFMKFLHLAEKSDNMAAAAYETLLIILRIFKSLGNKEPFPIKKIREDLEYVFLIQMYLNGSKELPERKTDNFNYALLSEFLKKDDLRVLKSIEDYLDSAETKALGAAGSVAQSIEKEDLEPGVKKVKKDIERIEKLED